MLEEHKQPNIEVQLRDLRPALDGMAKVVRRKVTLPILGTIKVEVSASNAVRLTATDLDVFLSVNIPAKVTSHPAHRKSVEAKSSFLIRFGELQEEMQRRRYAHPESTLTLSALVFRGEKVAEFPVEPRIPSGQILELDKGLVRGLLNAFASTSEDETRYVLRGVLVDTTDAGKGKLVATDGRHMYVHEAPGLPVLTEPFILPDHKIWTWKRLLNPIEPWSLHLEEPRSMTPIGVNNRSKEESTAHVFRVEGANWSISGRCIEGNFPNYRQVIPDSSGFTSHMVLPPDTLGSIVSSLAQLPGKKLLNRPVAMEIDGKVATILAKDTDRENDDSASWVRMGIPMSVHRGPKLTVALNRDYLIRALRCGLNHIDMKDANSPLKFSRDGAFMIVMPVRLATPPAFPRKAKRARRNQRKAKANPVKPAAMVPAKRELPATAEPSSPNHAIREVPRTNWIIGFTVWLFGVGEKEKHQLPHSHSPQKVRTPIQPQPTKTSAKPALKSS